MVPYPGKTLRVSACKPVNLPEPISIQEAAPGKPVAIGMSGRQVVATIDDCWRIDDEWWRSQPVSRIYYTVHLASGQRWTIYKDLLGEGWYRQTY
jgi:hypothetical protein